MPEGGVRDVCGDHVLELRQADQRVRRVWDDRWRPRHTRILGVSARATGPDEVAFAPGNSLTRRYDHFDAEGCKLFDDEEVARIRMQEALDARRRQQQALRAPPQGWHGARGIGAEAKGCPYCRARVVKFDNSNHIQCWCARDVAWCGG